MATRVYRELVAEDGFTVLDAHVKYVQKFAQAYGSPIVRAAASPYGAIVDELLAQPTPNRAGVGSREDPR